MYLQLIPLCYKRQAFHTERVIHHFGFKMGYVFAKGYIQLEHCTLKGNHVCMIVNICETVLIKISHT